MQSVRASKGYMGSLYRLKKNTSSNIKSLAIVCDGDLAGKRVLIIGGTGRVGLSTALNLRKNVKDLDIALGGRNKMPYEKAIEANKSLQQNTQFIAVDIEDSDSLIRAIGGFDLVVHSAGPFQQRTSCSVLEAAISLGVPYIDVCDDLEYSQRAKSYHGKAIDAGVCAVTTTGVYPGLSNIMAAHIISLTNGEYDENGLFKQNQSSLPSTEKDEEVDRIRYSYFTAGSGGAGQTLLVTSNMLLAEPVTVYADGKRILAPPFYQPMQVDFGPSLGKKDCFLMNLPEVESARQVFGAPNISARFSTSPFFWNWLMWAMARYIPRKVLSNRQSMTKLASLSEPFIRFFDKFVGESVGIRVDVTFKSGKSAAAVYVHQSLAASVGTCTAAFARCILEGDSSPGLWFPEEKGAFRARRKILKYASEGCKSLIVNRPRWEIETDPIPVGLGFYL